MVSFLTSLLLLLIILILVVKLWPAIKGARYGNMQNLQEFSSKLEHLDLPGLQRWVDGVAGITQDQRWDLIAAVQTKVKEYRSPPPPTPAPGGPIPAGVVKTG